MGEKTKGIKITTLSPKFRWEFFRLNEEYNNFYRKCIACRKKSNYDKDFEKQVCYIGWGLSGLADPNRTYEENRRLLKGDIFIPTAVSIKADFTKPKPLLEGKITIGLESPKRAIMLGLERQLGYYLSLYNKSKRKNRIKEKARRVRLDVLERNLEVYKLFQKGWTPGRLAKKFYTGDIDSAKRRIRRDIARCKELIEYRHGQIR